MLLEKLWDDVVAGPRPDHGLGKLRKLTPLNTNKDGEKLQRSISIPSLGSTSSGPISPLTPTTPSSVRREKENVWRSVFHPGSNLNTKTIGAHIFDKPTQPSSPTVYDWLYSGETKSKYC